MFFVTLENHNIAGIKDEAELVKNDRKMKIRLQHHLLCWFIWILEFKEIFFDLIASIAGFHISLPSKQPEAEET